MLEIEEYLTKSGDSPFGTWLRSLKDKRAQARILARLDRVRLGNFGDWKTLSGTAGLAELRDPYGPGYRIYFSIFENRLVLLLAGSTKRDQRRTIRQAEHYLDDYRKRAGK